MVDKKKKLPPGDYYTVRWFEARPEPAIGFDIAETLAPTPEDAEAIETHLTDLNRKGITITPEHHKKSR